MKDSKKKISGTIIITIVMAVLIIAAIIFAVVIKNSMDSGNASNEVGNQTSDQKQGDVDDDTSNVSDTESSTPMEYDEPEVTSEAVVQSSLKEDADYLDFVKNELVSQYSLSSLEPFTEDANFDVSTIDGLIGAYVGDLDNNGTEELLTIRFESGRYYDYEGEKVGTNAVVLSVYSKENGSIELIDEIDTTQFSIRACMNIFHDNTSAAGVEVFIKFSGDKKYICFENTEQVNMMDNSIAILEFENNKLNIVEQLAIYQSLRSMETIDIDSDEQLYYYGFDEETKDEDILDFMEVHEQANKAMQEKLKQYGIDGNWLYQYYDETQQNPLSAPISQFESNVLDLVRLTETCDFENSVSSGTIFDYTNIRDMID